MKLSDLKNGAVVEIRNGERYLKVDNKFLNLNMSGTFAWVDDYNEGLLDDADKDYDIVKVALGPRDARNEKWTWVREEKILTEKEKEYLSFIIKPFKDRVVSIKKIDIGGAYVADWLMIDCKSIIKEIEYYDFIRLPLFEKGISYKGMKYDYRYTLEKLGLK